MRTRSNAVGLLLLLIMGIVLVNSRAESEYKIIVSAGAYARRDTIVSFPLPAAAFGFDQLRDSSGHLLPLQVQKDGRAFFILNELPAGRTRTFELVHSSPASLPGSEPGGVQAVRGGSKVKFTSGDRVILEYHAEPGPLPRPDIKPIYTRGGYIHPLSTPSGRLVTDDYPPNHIHQHGIWLAWTKTEFQGRQPDFWNMGDGKGRVEFAGLDRIWPGPVLGGLQARHRFVDLTAGEPRTALEETWRLFVYGPGAGGDRYHVFDLTSTQECAGEDPLLLPRYHYGGLGVRGNWLWNGPNEAFFLTSNGVTNRIEGNETRGRWCYLGGMIEGCQAGLVILSHPDNFRAPQPLRLHPSEPYLSVAPSQLGLWRIEPGKPYISRYRFAAFDGPPDREDLDRLWNDYAYPPELKVERRQ